MSDKPTNNPFDNTDYDDFKPVGEVVNKNNLIYSLNYNTFSGEETCLKEKLVGNFLNRANNLANIMDEITEKNLHTGRRLAFAINKILAPNSRVVDNRFPYFRGAGLVYRINEKYGSAENKEIKSFLTELKEYLQKTKIGIVFPPELEKLLQEEAHYKEDNAALEGLLKVLEEHGIKRISGKTPAGASAIVLTTTDNQMVRIIREDTKKLQSLPPTALQPLYTIDNIDGFCIQIMPKVHVLREILASDKLRAEYGIMDDYELEKGKYLLEEQNQWREDQAAVWSPEIGYDERNWNIMMESIRESPYPESISDENFAKKYIGIKERNYIQQLKADSYKYGSYAWDIDKDAKNIGLIKDKNGKTVPVIIDLEAVASLKNTPETFKECFTEREWDIERTKKLPPTNTDYLAAQKAHVERLGLEYGSIKGAFNNAELEKELKDFADKRASQKNLAAENGHKYPENPLWVDVVKYGVSKSELGHHISNIEKPSDKGFCHDIRAQLEAKNAIPARQSQNLK